jgi:hypothetical protein
MQSIPVNVPSAAKASLVDHLVAQNLLSEQVETIEAADADISPSPARWVWGWPF